MNRRRRGLRDFLKNNSLYMQLTLYFFAVSIVIITVDAYLIYRNMTEMLKERNEELVLQQFAQVERNVSSLYHEVDRLMDIFQRDPSVQEYIQNGRYALIYPDVVVVSAVYKKITEILQYYSFIDSIYLFTADNEAIGANRRYTLIADKTENEHIFFQDKAFQEAFSETARNKWYSGYSSFYFNDLIHYTTPQDEKLISHVKTMYTEGKLSRKGVIVFNIAEAYLLSLYSALTDTADDKLYLVNNEGEVVSALNDESGVFETFFDGEEQLEQYGSLTITDRPEPTQLIYYRIAPLDWFIVREIPIRTDLEHALAAQQNFVITTALVSILSVLILTFFWIRRVISPLRRLAQKMRETGKGDFETEIEPVPHNEIGLVVYRFNDMQRSLNELMRENERIEKEKRLLEIEALQAQINPHFLYNTLNMIKWMATAIRANNIVNSLVALGNILRPVFRSRNMLWALREELEYLGNYVKIMNWRYNNAIDYQIDVDPGCYAYSVPQFILQPLLENAVVHGMAGLKDELIVRIEIAQTDRDLLITVTDNGTGIPPEVLEKLTRQLSGPADELIPEEKRDNQKIGITNVARRIRLYYGESNCLTISSPVSEEGGTRIFIRFSKELKS